MIVDYSKKRLKLKNYLIKIETPIWSGIWAFHPCELDDINAGVVLIDTNDIKTRIRYLKEGIGTGVKLNPPRIIILGQSEKLLKQMEESTAWESIEHDPFKILRQPK